jgi:hypothetical protein
MAGVAHVRSDRLDHRSAVGQAASAVAIAGADLLPRALDREVHQEKAGSTELQGQANAISSGLLARSTREAAAFLGSAPGGGSGSKGGAATHGVSFRIADPRMPTFLTSVEPGFRVERSSFASIR